MGIFPRLDMEGSVQVGDKTRFLAKKSFVSPAGTAALTSLVLVPGVGGGSQDIYDASDPNVRYLDWVFSSWSFDIVAGFNDSIDFSQGGTDLVGTVAPGSYTFSQLLTAIETALNDDGDDFTVSADANNKITIESSETFELLPNGDNKNTSLLPHIGFGQFYTGLEKNLNGTSVVGDIVEYGHKKITLTADNGTTPVSIVRYIKLYSELGDRLFSSDQDLMTFENDIMQWVPDDRSSFLNIHREAQNQILYWLDKEGYVNIYQQKFTKHDIVDFSEVRQWSTFIALSIIMFEASNEDKDVYMTKYNNYLSRATDARKRAALRLDVDKDGKTDPGEQLSIQFGTVVTR